MSKLKLNENDLKGKYNILDIELTFYKSISEFYNIINFENLIFCSIFIACGYIISYVTSKTVKYILSYIFGVDINSYKFYCKKKIILGNEIYIRKNNFRAYITYFRILFIERIVFLAIYGPIVHACYKILTRNEDLYYFLKITILLIFYSLRESSFASGFALLLSSRSQNKCIIKHTISRFDLRIDSIGWFFTSCTELNGKLDEDDVRYELSIPNIEIMGSLRIKKHFKKRTKNNSKSNSSINDYSNKSK